MIPYVRLISRQFRSEINLVHVLGVFPPIPGVTQTGPGSYRNQLLGNMVRRAQDYLDEVASSLEDDGLSVSRTVLEGRPIAFQIIKEAEKRPGTLIALSTHTRPSIVRWCLGSVTESILQDTTSSVLVVGARVERSESGVSPVEIKSVIVPLDGSESAEQILFRIIALSRVMSVEVILVQDVGRRHGAMANGYLESMVAKLLQLGVRSRAKVFDSEDLGKAISKFADEIPGSLVATRIGSRSGIATCLPCCGVEPVIWRSKVPVLVVPTVDPTR